MKSFVFVILFGASSAYAGAVGFELGDQYESVIYSGRTTVYCPARAPEIFYCNAGGLSPGVVSHFVAEGVQADKVRLKAYWQNGRTRSKNHSFSDGRTRSKVNLWINTLFQRPLLAMGANKIEYTLSKSGETVEEGQFLVNVQDGGRRVCDDGYYHAPASLCQSVGGVDYATACNHYFSRARGCE